MSNSTQMQSINYNLFSRADTYKSNSNLFTIWKAVDDYMNGKQFIEEGDSTNIQTISVNLVRSNVNTIVSKITSSPVYLKFVSPNKEISNDLTNYDRYVMDRTAHDINQRAVALDGYKYNKGIIEQPGDIREVDQALIDDATKTIAEYKNYMDNMKLSDSIKLVWSFISRTNKYIDETTPWVLGKDEARKAELNRVLYDLVESLRAISVMIEPFIPTTARRIWAQLNLPQNFDEIRISDIEGWGKTPVGIQINKPEQLFPRIEIEEEKPEAKKEEPKAPEKAKENEDGMIGIEDFSKIDLRVVEILAAEPVPKTDKLMKIQVSLGDEERTVVSGIAKFYKPEDLIGKHVVLVANLKPAKLRGVMSHGMLLAASKGDELQIVETTMPVGSKVK